MQYNFKTGVNGSNVFSQEMFIWISYVLTDTNLWNTLMVQ